MACPDFSPSGVSATKVQDLDSFTLLGLGWSPSRVFTTAASNGIGVHSGTPIPATTKPGSRLVHVRSEPVALIPVEGRAGTIRRLGLCRGCSLRLAGAAGEIEY